MITKTKITFENFLKRIIGINQTFYIFELTQFLQLLGNQAKLFIVLSVFVIDGLTFNTLNRQK